MSKKHRWTIERIGPQVHRIRFPNVKAGWEQWVLLMSDEHFDNAECDRAMLTQHHKEAAERNAPICKFGDTFCAMQGKWDKQIFLRGGSYKREYTGWHGQQGRAARPIGGWWVRFTARTTHEGGREIQMQEIRAD